MTIDFTIQRFRPVLLEGEMSNAVAQFTASANGFSLRKMYLRQRLDGSFVVGGPARPTGDFGIALSPGPVRDFITDALVQMYHDKDWK